MHAIISDTGRRDSEFRIRRDSEFPGRYDLEMPRDFRPRLRSDLPPRKKGYFMDDAIGKTKFGFFNYLLIGLSGMTLFVALLECCGMVYVFPVSQCDLHLSASEKGILGGAAPLGVICSAHLWGYLADTKGRRAVILPCLLVAFILSSSVSLVENFYLFTVLRFFSGFFISGASAPIYAYLGEFHNDRNGSRAIMAAAAIFSVACVLIPLIAWGVINQDFEFQVPLIDVTYKAWRFYLVVCSLPEVIIGVILFFLPESPRFVLDKGHKHEAYEILKKVHRWNNGDKVPFELFEIVEEPEAIENRRRKLDCENSRFPLLNSIWNQTAPHFKRPYLRSTSIVCIISLICCASSQGFYIFFAQIVNTMATNLDSFYDQRMMMCDIINMKPANSSTLEVIGDEVCVTKIEFETLKHGIVVEAIFGVGQIVVALTIRKIGNYPIVFGIFIICGLGAPLCMLSDIPIVQVYGYIDILSCGLALNVINSVAVELFPTSLRAMAMCIVLMAGRLGGIAGSNIAALFLESHCEMVFYSAGTSILAIGVLSFFVPTIHRKFESSPEMQNDPRLSIMSFRGTVN